MARKGLPSKYAKMGFKKGWREFRKVHPKGGKKRKASSKPAKKSGSKKKYYPKKAKKGSGSTTKNKFTQGDLFMTDAMAGAAIRSGLVYMENGDIGAITSGIPLQYTGYNATTKEFQPEEMVRGWGGTVNEILARKLSRMTGVQAYPSKKSILELAAFYSKDVMNALDNQGDIQAFYTQHYKDYHGVDLAGRGFDAYQPMEMADTRLPLWLIKQGKKAIRGMGYNLPKWV